MKIDPSLIQYAPTDIPYLTSISILEKQTGQRVSKSFSSMLNRLENLINADYAVGIYLFKLAALTNSLSGVTVKENVLSAYHKGLFAIVSSFKLTKMGYIGPARPNLRFLVETLTVAKFCSLSKNDRVYNKWLKGDRINFQNDILNRITTPDTVHIKNLWMITSEYTHGTIYSQQISFEWNYLKKEVYANLSLLEILLHFHCHLLLSHVMQSGVRYYFRYLDNNQIQDLKEKKTLLRKALTLSKKNLSADAKAGVKQYCSKWDIC
jgi:hypothetical protein